MSLEATGWAWNQTGLNTSQKIVLLALADQVRSAESGCFPMVSSLMAKSELSKTSVIRAIRELEARGLVAAFPLPSRHGGRQHANYYLLAIHGDLDVSRIDLDRVYRLIERSELTDHDPEYSASVNNNATEMMGTAGDMGTASGTHVNLTPMVDKGKQGMGTAGDTHTADDMGTAGDRGMGTAGDTHLYKELTRNLKPNLTGVGEVGSGVDLNVVWECLPARWGEHLDSSGLQVVGHHLAGLLDAGWTPQRIRCVLESNPLPESPKSWVGLISHRVKGVPAVPPRLAQSEAPRLRVVEAPVVPDPLWVQVMRTAKAAGELVPAPFSPRFGEWLKDRDQGAWEVWLAESSGEAA
ncbi:MAG: helix-turn-helix domain-containing protein [Propionibacteriaceae bacterium]|jgi:hypothetical protein|nr:helix-turn-helix domain-containing protein [Propionibacteriaceae bacterium]